MKAVWIIAFGIFAACSAPVVPTSTKLSNAEVEIQKARSLPGFNASNFLPGPATEAAPLLRAPEEISATLKKGGYIVCVRHGRAQYEQIALEREHRAPGTFDLNNCANQRALSYEGRAALKMSGELFRRAGVPIDQAFVSRYCRAIESAACFVEVAKPTDMLSGEGQVGKDPAQKARTVTFLSQVPATVKNHYMMAHGGIFWEATGFVIQEEHAVLLDLKNLKVLVARIAPDE
jgi:phosphohistidine phosphatase SixA